MCAGERAGRQALALGGMWMPQGPTKEQNRQSCHRRPQENAEALGRGEEGEGKTARVGGWVVVGGGWGVVVLVVLSVVRMEVVGIIFGWW